MTKHLLDFERFYQDHLHAFGAQYQSIINGQLILLFDWVSLL